MSSDARRDSIVPPAPAMPVVNLPPRPPPPTSSAQDVLRELEALAQNKDIPRMVAGLSQVVDLEERGRLAAQVGATLAAREVPFALEFAGALPAGRTRDRAAGAIAHAVAQRNGAESIEWALGLADSPVAVVARRTVVEDLTLANPRGAIDRLTALPPGSRREDLLAIAAATWARLDPVAAVDWVRALPDDERKQRLTSTVAFEIAQANPDRALALAETLPQGRNRWLLLSAIGQTWVARDPKAALAWANRLPAGEPREAAFAGIDTGLGMPTSRRVASSPGTIGGGSRNRGAGATVAWPEMSSPDFAAWLATQRPGMSREEAILEYVRQRGASQPWAVGPWLASLPGGPARDQAMDIFVEGLVISSPSDAARWISQLPRSDRNIDMIEKTARQWLITNPAAAEAWLRESSLPLERKEQLLREAGR